MYVCVHTWLEYIEPFQSMNAYMKRDVFVGFKVVWAGEGRPEVLLESWHGRWLWPIMIVMLPHSLNHSATFFPVTQFRYWRYNKVYQSLKLYQSHITGRQNVNMTHQSCEKIPGRTWVHYFVTWLVTKWWISTVFFFDRLRMGWLTRWSSQLDLTFQLELESWNLQNQYQ